MNRGPTVNRGREHEQCAGVLLHRGHAAGLRAILARMGLCLQPERGRYRRSTSRGSTGRRGYRERGGRKETATLCRACLLAPRQPLVHSGFHGAPVHPSCSGRHTCRRPWRRGRWRVSDSRLVSLFVLLDVPFRRQQHPERVCVFRIPWMIIISANRVMTRRFGKVFACTSGGPRTARRLPGQYSWSVD